MGKGRDARTVDGVHQPQVNTLCLLFLAQSVMPGSDTAFASWCQSEDIRLDGVDATESEHATVAASTRYLLLGPPNYVWY